MKWGKNFLALDCPIVLFTSSDLAPLIKKIRGDKPIQIIEEEFEEIHMWKHYKDTWEIIRQYDSYESHTPELYAVWANKCVWTARVAAENPFGTENFFWCDFGAFRDASLDPILQKYFPRNTLFTGKKLISLLLEEFTGKKTESIFCEDGSIGGGLWGGGAEACIRFRTLYEEMLIRYFANSIRIGQDQQIMASVFWENPDLVDLIQIVEYDKDRWFFLEYLLSYDGIPYKLYRHPRLTAE